jgi:hypothetical protein
MLLLLFYLSLYTNSLEEWTTTTNPDRTEEKKAGYENKVT